MNLAEIVLTFENCKPPQSAQAAAAIISSSANVRTDAKISGEDGVDTAENGSERTSARSSDGHPTMEVHEYEVSPAVDNDGPPNFNVDPASDGDGPEIRTQIS